MRNTATIPEPVSDLIVVELSERVPVPVTAVQPEPISEAEIAELAFSLFEARGFEHGHDVEDWLAAEALLLERRARQG